MLSKISVVTTFVLSAALFARADVTPSEPGPGSSYTAGQTCSLTWLADKDSPTAWKNMNIQLMTGSNFDMVHLTTIATNQDGTVDGRFTYPCPEVTPYSAIYFYQFTAPGAPEKQWATRFTITSPDGQTTPPTNANQPGTNEPIPWGTGALADPSTAVPAPASAGGPGTGTGAAANVTASSTASVSRTGTPGSSSSASRSSTATSRSGSPAPTSNSTASQTMDSGAHAAFGVRSVVLGSVVALAAAALSL